MIIKPLYKIVRTDGGVTVSPNKPLEDVAYTECVRIIADEDKLVTLNGVDTYQCVDVETPDDWYEVDEEIADSEALSIIVGEDDI